MNTLEYLLEKYPDKLWDWVNISKNPNLTMEIIEKYPDKPWEWKYGISKNPNITIKFIKTHIDNIDFSQLSCNKFTYENNRMKKKESYWLLEEIQVFNKTENLVIVGKYV